MSVSRAFRKLAVDDNEPVKSNKRRKHTKSDATLAGVISEDEDPEDVNFLFSEDESAPVKGKLGTEELTML